MGLTLHKVCPRGKAIFVFEISIKIRLSLMSDFVSNFLSNVRSWQGQNPKLIK